MKINKAKLKAVGKQVMAAIITAAIKELISIGTTLIEEKKPALDSTTRD